MIEFKELSTDELSELQAGTRSGYAVETMDGFLASGMQAADISDQFPNKKLQNVSQALKRLTQRPAYQNVKVVFVTRDGNETLALVRTNA